MAENNDSREEAIKKFAAELSEYQNSKAKPTEQPAQNLLPASEKSAEWKDWEEKQNLLTPGEGVYSIKTKREVNPDAPRGIVSEQKKDFEKIRAKEPLSGPEPMPTTSILSAVESKNETSPEFEKAKAEWKDARDRARKLEEEYKTKYEAHILKESKGFRALANLPRRVFGFQPNLTDELKALQEASLVARREYAEAGKNLKEVKLVDGKTIDQVQKIAGRYERMLAYHLVVGTQKRRLEAQQKAVGEAWGTSKLKPVMEAINKHKYARIGVTAIGYGVLAGATGGLAAAAVGSGAYLGRVMTAMGLGAGVGLGGEKFYVGAARKRLQEAEKTVGSNFFEKDFISVDQKMSELTFEVSARQARVRTAAMAAGLGVGLIDTEPSAIDNSVPEMPEETTAPLPEVVHPAGESTESTTSAEVETAVQVNDGEMATGRADGDVSALSRSSGSGVERVPMDNSSAEVENESSKPDSLTKDKIIPEAEAITKDYSLPPFSSLSDLPSQGIIESVPQDPIESPTMSEGSNLNPMTESEATATFGPVVGPDIDSLQQAGVRTHIVEKGENVWNILEGKGPDAHPVGGKSEVLEGMSQMDREASLNKLLDYAEQNPEFAKEVGAVKSGDLNIIHAGEEINVTMLDDKLRELIGSGNHTSEITTPPETGEAPEVTAPAKEVSAAEVVQPEPVAMEAEEPAEVPYSETTPEPYDINSMRVGDILAMHDGVQSGDPRVLEELNLMGFDKDSYNALNEAISSHIQPGESYDMTLPLTEWMNQYGQEVAPAPADTLEPTQSSPILDRVEYTPEDTTAVVQEANAPVVENAALTAVKEYVTGVEKATSGFLFSGRPDVSGTFESLKGLSIGEFKALAANDNLSTELQNLGVSYNGFERWGETLEKQVKLVPANDTESVGDYIARVTSTRTA